MLPIQQHEDLCILITPVSCERKFLFFFFFLFSFLRHLRCWQTAYAGCAPKSQCMHVFNYSIFSKITMNFIIYLFHFPADGCCQHTILRRNSLDLSAIDSITTCDTFYNTASQNKIWQPQMPTYQHGEGNIERI